MRSAGVGLVWCVKEKHGFNKMTATWALLVGCSGDSVENRATCGKVKLFITDLVKSEVLPAA